MKFVHMLYHSPLAPMTGCYLQALCTEASLHALRRHYPQIYDTHDKLLVDPAAVRVARPDFLAAFKTITPSSHRSAVAHARWGCQHCLLLSVCLSVCLSVSLSVCLSVCAHVCACHACAVFCGLIALFALSPIISVSAAPDAAAICLSEGRDFLPAFAGHCLQLWCPV